MKPRGNWSIVALPDHEGVFNVGGRLGAARGPDALSKAFARFKPALPGRSADRTLTPVERDVARNHERAIRLVADAHPISSALSVVVGGGHDHGYSQLEGIRQAFRRIHGKDLRLGCINLDAHLDLRSAEPKITSGSPFWLAIEKGTIRGEDLVEFGIQPQCNAPELLQYARTKKVSIVPFGDLRGGSAVSEFEKALATLSSRCDQIVVSLDLDCLAQAFAPGVSAPVAEGFTPMEIYAILEAAGKSPKVPSLGIFELNPEHDIDHRTAILGATAVYRFLSAALARTSG